MKRPPEFIEIEQVIVDDREFRLYDESFHLMVKVGDSKELFKKFKDYEVDDIVDDRIKKFLIEQYGDAIIEYCDPTDPDNMNLEVRWDWAFIDVI